MRNLFIVWTLIFVSCTDRTERNNELWKMVRSKDFGQVVQATEEIRRSGDTSMISALLVDATDPRLSYSLLHKGKSIYQLKMEALQKITGVSPPKKITDEVDTSIIQFYESRFLQK